MDTSARTCWMNWSGLVVAMGHLLYDVTLAM
ncbi:hypothetical protein RD1_4026 [Roseobacter denitrificans OCh 114]|uniref:Uncharacterized protein n=1 Tax=Roseobacter denitrificans (strain ATCC 33942 / OCh 114) TaxID=375451 RepID=Q160X0_ROSDO|nr:hypothetical protein RD1_4026 [Roseobacter denitrificans OCh 114]